MSTKDRVHEGIHFPTHPDARNYWFFHWAVNTWLLHLLHFDFLLDFLTVLDFSFCLWFFWFFVVVLLQFIIFQTYSWHCFFHLSWVIRILDANMTSSPQITAVQSMHAFWNGHFYFKKNLHLSNLSQPKHCFTIPDQIIHVIFLF